MLEAIISELTERSIKRLYIRPGINDTYVRIFFENISNNCIGEIGLDDDKIYIMDLYSIPQGCIKTTIDLNDPNVDIIEELTQLLDIELSNEEISDNTKSDN